MYPLASALNMNARGNRAHHEALAAANRRGVELGNPNTRQRQRGMEPQPRKRPPGNADDVLPAMGDIQAGGAASNAAIAANATGKERPLVATKVARSSAHS